MHNKKIKVIIGTPTGFCSGVKRAIAIVKQEVKKSSKKTNVYTLGPIVHNADVVNELKSLGVKIMKTLNPPQADRTKNANQPVVIICSHGSSPKVIDKLTKLGYRVVDATCPYVKRVQNQAVRLKNEGFLTMIVGDKHHPEVKGIMGYAQPLVKVCDVHSNPEFNSESKFSGGRIGIIGQTTIPFECFQSAANSFNIGNYKEIRIINTLCKESLNRQRTCQEISAKVDLMIVVGSRDSANTLSLANIAKKMSTKVLQVENSKDLYHQIENCKLSVVNFKQVGIIAGASTPQESVFEVVQAIKNHVAESQRSLEKKQKKHFVCSVSWCCVRPNRVFRPVKRRFDNKKISKNRGTYANG